MRRGAVLALVSAAAAATLGSKCIPEDPLLTSEAAPPGAGGAGGAGGGDAGGVPCGPDLPLTPANMIALVCRGGMRCDDGLVERYWELAFAIDDPATPVRTRVVDLSASGATVRDTAGAEATLDFNVGQPSRLVLRGDGTADFTAPWLFRNVAIHRIRGAHDYRAHHVDALVPAAGEELVVEMVPIVAGEYEAWSSAALTGVAGLDYSGYVAHKRAGGGDAADWLGETTPITTIAISGPQLILFQEESVERDHALDSAPERGDAFWEGLATGDFSTCDVTTVENSEDDFRYVWTCDGAPPIDDGGPVTLTVDRPYVLSLADTSDEDHDFYAPALFRDAVVRRIVDPQGQVRTSSLTSVRYRAQGAAAATLVELVPKYPGRKNGYCAKGSPKSNNGTVDFSVGHASLGMLNWIDVVAP